MAASARWARCRGPEDPHGLPFLPPRRLGRGLEAYTEPRHCAAKPGLVPWSAISTPTRKSHLSEISVVFMMRSGVTEDAAEVITSTSCRHGDGPVAT